MKRPDFWVILIFIVIILTAFISVTPLRGRICHLQNEMSELKKIYGAQNQKLAEMQKEIRDLNRGDRKTVERIAREKFNYCYEGEELYQLEVITPKEDVHE